MAAAAVLPVGPVGQPDINYAPDYEKYLKRGARRLETEKLASTLPDGFPSKLNSDLVWDGESIGKEFNWTYALNAAEIDEIENALTHFKSLNLPLGHVNQETFPLPTLRPALRAISREIHHGHGFQVLRGLPVSKHTREENIIIYAGVSSHIAPIRGRQDHQYNGAPADVVLAHIFNLSDVTDISKIGAPAYSTEKQVFHTDSGDIIALLCLSEAAEGGQSKLSSSWLVYNELARTRPDLIRTLAEPWPVEVFGNPNKKFAWRPLLQYQPATETSPERIQIQYARRTFTGYGGLPRSTDIPPITESQAEALDALHFLAEKHSVGLDFRQGDVQYVNNLSIFHARDGFKDSAEKKRHLVRLWLRDPENAWKIAEVFQDRWDVVYNEVSPDRTVFPPEPYLRSASKGGQK